MSRRCWACLLLACMTTAAAIAAPVDNDPRTAALNQYKHDLVSVLTLRGDTPHLLGAALLARTFGDDSDPGQDYTRLLARAAAADPGNAAVTWARLSDCEHEARNCPNNDALAQLQQEAPDNAAVWILALDAAARDDDRKAQLADLHKAAHAKSYNDYGGALLQALTLAATALPVPEKTVHAYVGSASSKGGPASAQAFLAYGQAATQLQPSFLPIMELCDPKAIHDTDATLKSCRKLAQLLAWGSSPRARAAGLHLQDILASDKSARSAAKSEMRDLTWQLRNYSRLVLKALDDQDLALELLRLGQSGGSELTRMNALLHRQSIPTEAPPSAPEPAASTAAPATAARLATPASNESTAAAASASSSSLFGHPASKP